jgi:hypothetical protein
MDNGLVERKFVASLHKALEDLAPERLEIFKKWFDPADRRPQFHIATVIGAIGYLRRSPDLYHKVMEKAGHYASQWSCLDLPRIERKFRFRLPFGRDRLVKHLLQRGLKSIHRDGELETARDGDKLVVTVSNSLFCRTEKNGGEPTCEYYSALFAGLLDCTHENWSSITESACRAQGDSSCRFEALP